MRPPRCIAPSLIVFLTVLAAPATVFAQAGGEPPPSTPGSAPAALDDHDALRRAMAKNPSLRAALVDIERARANVSAEEDRYPLTLQLDVGANSLESPRLASSPLGPTTQVSSTQNLILGSELRKSFPWGTSLSFRVETSATRSVVPILPNSPIALTLGPGYAISARLSVVQPLLRGFGEDVGEADLRAAALDESASSAASDRAASETLRDVLTGYWELWYGGEAKRIEERARALAQIELDDIEARIEAGVAPPADVHTFVTSVAERDEAVLVAQLEQERLGLELGLLLGEPGDSSRRLRAGPDRPPAVDDLPDVSAMIDAAVAASPELEELDAQIAVAQNRERVAGEADRQRLDVEGWVQTQGLGNESVPPALQQFGTLGVFSAHVGLVYELPLTGSRVDSQKAAARHATDAAELQREAARQRIESQIRTLHQRAKTALRRVELAARTLKASEARLAGAKDRYELGNGLAVDIERAEDARRRAALREARAEVDAVVARLALDHLTGQLLRRYAGDVAELLAGSGGHVPPAPRGPF